MDKPIATTISISNSLCSAFSGACYTKKDFHSSYGFFHYRAASGSQWAKEPLKRLWSHAPVVYIFVWLLQGIADWKERIWELVFTEY